MLVSLPATAGEPAVVGTKALDWMAGYWAGATERKERSSEWTMQRAELPKEKK